MSEEQKEKWYNSFTREQLIERCEYLQRSCERKENSIMELEMENADLETKIEKREAIIKEVREYINKIPTQPVIRVFKKELLEILDKENNNE